MWLFACLPWLLLAKALTIQLVEGDELKKKNSIAYYSR